MSPKSFAASESAVSESIGYILILGIMVFAIGIVYMIGYPALQNSIDDSHLQNMERGFTILGDNIDHVVTQDAPKQSVELNLKGGTLMAKSGDTFHLILSGDVNTYDETPLNIMQITYVYHGDKQIGYEFNGVWENIGSNGYSLKDPQIIVGDPFIIPIVDADSSGRSSIGGEGVAKVIINAGATTVIERDNIKTITIIVKSDYYKGWDRYFKSIGMMTVPDDNTKTVTATYDATIINSNGVRVMEINKPLYIDIIV